VVTWKSEFGRGFGRYRATGRDFLLGYDLGTTGVGVGSAGVGVGGGRFFFFFVLGGSGNYRGVSGGVGAALW